MSILHHRRNVKRRAQARAEHGRESAPHMYPRASSRGLFGGGQAADAAPAAPAAPKPRRKAKRRRKAKAKAKA